ncbi:chemotaxis protein CheW [Robbsia sp. Bb-Pol-6]|uniref:Chemotaxis protein CheW n=1 Tax=Robbsia betulipollinis TaxID=2981849 RepID=A0ABT3ZGT6_9BURK|nr:chemotaxis protein CheW [Robbsia betulipollinis]MCY0385741.1 chemotaxis protein CheW [Robbsia betulipollinis]
MMQTTQAVDAHVPQGAEHAQYLTFVLGTEVFGLGILVVKEIIGYGGVTRVPMMSECVRGVINLRGSVIPVIDLGCRFGLGARPVTKRTCVVIVELAPAEGAGNGQGDAQIFGLIVDAVNAVLNIARADIEPPPAFGAKINATYLHGMGRVDERLIMLLEPHCILASENTEDAAGDAVPRLGLHS